MVTWLQACKIISLTSFLGYLLLILQALIEKEDSEEEGPLPSEEVEPVTSELKMKEPDQMFFIDTGADKSVQVGIA
jgi:hypothetical protein